MLFSIKLRTSLKEKHISGAERIVHKDDIPKVIKQLLERQNHKDFDFSNIKITKLDKNPIIIKKALNIKQIKFDNYQKALDFAISKLNKELDIKKSILEKYIYLLYTGASPDKTNQRGAMIVSISGKRLEKDKYKGIRTVLVDFKDRKQITDKLLKEGYTERTVDALALTTKNLNHPKILAEFCISDDKDYTTGYISLKGTYYRLLPLKPYGLDKGGRIYFVSDDIDIENLYNYLQNTPVIIEDIEI